MFYSFVLILSITLFFLADPNAWTTYAQDDDISTKCVDAFFLSSKLHENYHQKEHPDVIAGMNLKIALVVLFVYFQVGLIL